MAKETDSLDEAKHEHALKLVGVLRAVPVTQRLGALRAWLRVAEDITKATRRALCQGRERIRVARSRGGAVHSADDFLFDWVRAGVLQAAGRDELVEDDEEAVKDAVSESFRVAGEIMERNPLAAAALPWIAVAEGYARRRGYEVHGIHLVGCLGRGKERTALQVAALALAEIGFGPTDVAEALEIDPAYARRLTAPARVS